MLSSILSLLYPPLCLHCRESLEKGNPIFCKGCLEQLELIDPTSRCVVCFSTINQTVGKVCPRCLHKGQRTISQLAAVFDYMGPASTLIKCLKYSQQPYLAKGAGAFLVAQWVRLEWPLPDLIVPVPMAFTHWLERGYNQSALLAEIVAEALDRPLAEPLKRSSGDYRQAALNQQQRKKLTASRFHLNPKISLLDKTILLIDDVMTTSTTLEQCAQVLLEGHPKRIYGLTVCKALD